MIISGNARFHPFSTPEFCPILLRYHKRPKTSVPVSHVHLVFCRKRLCRNMVTLKCPRFQRSDAHYSEQTRQIRFSPRRETTRETRREARRETRRETRRQTTRETRRETAREKRRETRKHSDHFAPKLDSSHRWVWVPLPHVGAGAAATKGCWS